MFSFLNTRLLTRSSRQLQLQAHTKAQRLESVNDKARLPRSVQAVYLRPLRRKAEYGLPVCDLQLRSYSVRNVEFFADFAVRAAYYLKLPVSGPIPLPRIVERWTFPRSNFVHKKSQENFERITLRRLIQIKDGSPQAVQAWLAFLRKHAFYGVGMKANVWEQESLDVVRSMDKGIPDVEQSLAPHLSQFGRRKAGDSNNSAPELLDNMGSPATSRTIFSGIQPTGVPHLGNYLGALREWVRLQNNAEEGTKLFFSIVDLHALTIPQNSYQLKSWRKELFAILLAVGLDPRRSTIFYQSTVPAHTELYWILSTVASLGYLSRMTQWKSKLQLPEDTGLEHSAARSKLRLGLFSYPVLQAADILVHRATHVPVGEDQKQHLEFSRYTANSFNHLYGSIFPTPEALISPAKRVMSLKQPTLKMSKSHADHRSRILLTDSPDEIQKKVKVALTDSETNISYEPVRRPGVSNLLEILSHFDGRSCEELAFEYKEASLRSLKEHLAGRVSGHLEGIRERYHSLMEDRANLLDGIAEQGAYVARANADVTMKQVREAMGL
ncbi:tryptophanyl-tRNA synthetase [Aspergillus avenaceus]|uniref:Small ribosomal subunit protein uS10m n=1 Tax=Aspergillus avenaceus TaxID=36643 RepID=A0A5N6TGN4_ASPAV|nr:tryptophanyl-tRNA synthetase [Aspergillus avenaceus]